MPVLANASRICEAKFGTLYLCEDDGFRAVAMHNAPAGNMLRNVGAPLVHPGPSTSLGRVARTKLGRRLRTLRMSRIIAKGTAFSVTAVRLGGLPHCSSRPLAEGKRPGRCNRHISPGGQAVRVKSRLTWWRTSRSKPSSLSRTPGCSTSCASLCSNRPLRLTF